MSISTDNTAVVLFLVTSYGIPGAAAALTHVKWPTWVTGIITLLLSAAGGMATEAAVDPSHYDWKHGALLALGSVIVAGRAHGQLWEGHLASGLHRIGLTGVTADEIDMGVGYLEHSTPMAPYVPVDVPADVPEPVSDAPSVRHPSPGPLVTGSLAPEQTALEA